MTRCPSSHPIRLPLRITVISESSYPLGRSDLPFALTELHSCMYMYVHVVHAQPLDLPCLHRQDSCQGCITQSPGTYAPAKTPLFYLQLLGVSRPLRVVLSSSAAVPTVAASVRRAGYKPLIRGWTIASRKTISINTSTHAARSRTKHMRPRTCCPKVCPRPNGIDSPWLEVKSTRCTTF